MFMSDDKGNDIVFQTLLEHDYPTDTAVAVLKRMYGLETIMKVDYVLNRNILYLMIIGEKLLNLS